MKIKKLVFGLALLLAGVVSAQAQVTFGVKGGVNFSEINGNNISKSSLAGYEVGAFARLGDKWYLQPEAYLGSRGGEFKITPTSTGVTTTDKITFNTLNVPLLLGRKIGFKNFNVRLMAGLIYSYNISTSENFKRNVSDGFTDFGTYNNSTLGYQAGGGVDVGRLTVDLRYEGGLTYINTDYGQRANLVALSVGFKIF